MSFVRCPAGNLWLWLGWGRLGPAFVTKSLVGHASFECRVVVRLTPRVSAFAKVVVGVVVEFPSGWAAASGCVCALVRALDGVGAALAGLLPAGCGPAAQSGLRPCGLCGLRQLVEKSRICACCGTRGADGGRGELPAVPELLPCWCGRAVAGPSHREFKGWRQQL